jgi:hypothetical protein
VESGLTLEESKVDSARFLEALVPREAHKFDPVGRGLCSVCNLPKQVLQHKRWAEKEYEEALMAEQALLNLGGEWSQEEEDRRIEKAIKKVRT